MWNQVREEKLIFESFSSYGNVWDLGWLSFYDFFDRIGIDLGDKTNFYKFKELIECGIYDMIQMDKVCFVASLPKAINRDDLTRLHSTEKPAIEWRDGYNLHYLHGVFFEEKQWKEIVKGKISIKEVLSETNMERRMAIIKVMGVEKILEKGRLINSHTIKKRIIKEPIITIGNQKWGDKKRIIESVTYDLYEIENVFSQIAYFLRYQDPSTDRVYVSGIDPEIGKKGSALEAMAWKFNIPLDEIPKDGVLFDMES